jgi:hypothetical protein
VANAASARSWGHCADAPFRVRATHRPDRASARHSVLARRPACGNMA